MMNSVTETGYLGGRLRLCQPGSGYRAAIDPAFLAAAVFAAEGDRVLDLGAGVGTAGLCLAWRLPSVRVECLELQAPLAELATRNIELNGLGERMVARMGDATAAAKIMGAHPYDWVMTNPPWTEAGRGTLPPLSSKAMAHVEHDLDLDAWLKLSVQRLRPKGRLAVIHRADRVDALVSALGRLSMGEMRLYPLFPRDGEPASRIIVTARKSVRTPAALLPGMVLHDADGSYTVAARRVLELGEKL